MSFFNTLNTSASGLTAQRLRMDVISQNIANVNTTQTETGGPYKRKTVLFQERGNSGFGYYLNQALSGEGFNNGVRVARITEDQTKGNLIYDPTHPHANEEGYIEMPNVNIVEEMVNMISANRSYEAGVTAINTTKAMAAKTLEINSK